MSGGTVEAPGLGRAIARLLLVAVVVLLVLLLAAGWYFAGQLTAAPTVRPFEADTVVVDASEDRITLETTDDLATGGAFGVQLPADGYAALGAFVGSDGDTTTYEVVEYDGRVPVAGTPGRVDEFWRVGTPDDVGVAYEDVAVPGPLGDLPSWWVPDGDRGTVVYVHGRGATREEALRFLPTLTDAGWSTLVLSYRGDEGAPAFRDGRLRYGLEEYADVEAGVDWVTDRIGEDRPIVLFGASMGGAIIAQYLDRGRLADLVDGVVLDSPVLSLDDTLDLQADLNGVPEVVEPALLPTAQLIAGLLYGMDTDALEQTADDGTFDVPTLVFHGSADGFVPFTQSLLLADRDDDVEYVGYEQAGHVRSWNVDRGAYEATLVGFLDALP